MVPATLLLLFAVRGIAGFLADLALARITQDGLLKLRKAMFARLLDARLSLFSRENATSLSNTVVFEVQNGAELLVNSVIALLKDSLALLALLVYLLYLNWQLTLVVFAVVPGRRPDHAHPLAPPVPDRPQRPDRRQRPGLRGGGERAGGAGGAAARRPAGAGQPLRSGSALALRRLALKSAAASAAITPLTHMLAAAALSVVICDGAVAKRATASPSAPSPPSSPPC